MSGPNYQVLQYIISIVVEVWIYATDCKEENLEMMDMVVLKGFRDWTVKIRNKRFTIAAKNTIFEMKLNVDMNRSVLAVQFRYPDICHVTLVKLNGHGYDYQN